MIGRKYIEKAQPGKLVRDAEARYLTRMFCRAAGAYAQDVELPAAADPLERFKLLSNIVASRILSQPDDAMKAITLARVCKALGEESQRAGQLARKVLGAGDEDAFVVMRFLYAGIGIRIEGELPGQLRVPTCYFADTYDKRVCWVMSAMDQGIMRGLCGCGNLEFSQRLTEGCAACVASFTKED